MSLFNDAYYPTLKIIHEQHCLPGLWDTGAHEEYDRLRPIQYLNTDIFVVCFSIVSPSSFDNVTTKWIPEIKHHVPDAPFLLVGTKSDLRRSYRYPSEMQQEMDPETLVVGFIIHCLRHNKYKERNKVCRNYIPSDIVQIVMTFYGWSTIKPSEGLSLANQLGATAYLECSSLIGDGVKNLFDEAIRAALKRNNKKNAKCQIL